MTSEELSQRFPFVEAAVRGVVAALLSRCRSIDALLIVYDHLHAAGTEEITAGSLRYGVQLRDLARLCAERARELNAEEVHV